MLHTPVLLQEVMEGLDIPKKSIVVDATVGSGGHSEAMLQRFGADITLIGLDRDHDSLERSRERLEPLAPKIFLFQTNFRYMEYLLRDKGFVGVDRVLFDLGWSSDQFEESGRGFSFQKDEPLVMTFEKYENGESGEVTARMIVNDWKEETLADILWGFGEERYAKRIARAIVAERAIKPIETTFDLVRIINHATPSLYHHRKIHFATKTFQALRIAVNEEYKSLEEGLRGAWNILLESGRIAVISFHSGEDRIIKRFFKEREKEGGAIIITKKPIVPSREEQKENRRARSAKLRIISKVSERPS